MTPSGRENRAGAADGDGRACWRAHALDQNASIRQARPGSAHWIACLSSAPWFLSVTLVLTAVV
jgi:hypothetical protein